LCELVGDQINLQSSLTNIGIILQNKGKLDEAENYFIKSLNIATELGSLQKRCNAHYNLSSLYEAKNNLPNAFEHYKKHISLRDSLASDENTKKIIEQELYFSYQKKATADSVRVNGEKLIVDAQLKQEKTRRFALIGGIVMMFVFVIFLYNRFQVTRKQKSIIEEKEKETTKQNEIISHQKLLVEQKQNEIVESITYAKRLQEAILPSQHFINSFVPNNFIFFIPKDVVSGDFYWAEEVNGKFFIAACDSTGHGVPGALVSIVCSNALNRTVNEFQITETGKILDKTRELVLETFSKNNNDVQDGMDISLLCIDKNKKEIFWSGAHNPLWYVQDNILFEIKACKQPIGRTDLPTAFITHKILYKEGTMFYLFTDGFPDQFGGPYGKKFKYKPFENLLLSISSKPVTTQFNLTEQAFNNWKGEHEQVDDVCVIGICV
jgi:serine phosphatase RsbU (regulator of sigma subunit)